MPRKTRTALPEILAPVQGFNEAAARCRGKRWTSGRSRGRCRSGFNEAAARCRGKRQPRRERERHGPGFNEAAARCRGKRMGEVLDRLGQVASMRPRPDAAENKRHRWGLSHRPSASMRPRPDAAENSAGPASAGMRGGGFNEAAARCRGKHAQPRPGGGGRGASMRPRPDAAENAAGTPPGRRGRDCFNEAAARCRGKPAPPPPRRGRGRRFNEAAARCRGKP